MKNQEVSKVEFNLLANYVKDISGIVLDDTKSYLIESRLGPLLKDLNCENYYQLLNRSKADKTGTTKNQVIDAISTNETSFFRDRYPFEMLRKSIVPDLLLKPPKKKTDLNILSAACSTGQELYSIAIILKEVLIDLRRFKINIVGADISSRAIEMASEGIYTKHELGRGISDAQLDRHFIKEGSQFQIKEELRKLVSFQKTNLLIRDCSLGKFDIIFCRNVAIYFTREDRTKMFQRLAEMLVPSGVLFVGATELIEGLEETLNRRELAGKAYYERF